VIGNKSTTHYNSIFLALATTVGLLVTFVASAFIFTSNNPVAKLAMLIGGMLLLMGTVEPRRMLMVLVPITFYLDGVKRLLILMGRTDLDDVTSILAVAPMAALGIILGCIIRRIFFRKKGELVERLAIVGALVAFVAFGGTDIFTAGNLLFGMKTAANTTVYFLLPWALLQCFETRGEIERFFKYCLIIGVPAAIYGIWQFTMGLSEFEIAYLKSGLSTVGDVSLDDIRPRPFSTLSSVHAYSSVMMFMLALSVHFSSSWNSKKRSWKGPAIILIYAVAMALSMARSTTLASIVMLGFARFFRSKSGVAFAYSISTAFLGGMILFAEELLASLDKLQSYLPMDSLWQQQAFRLGTWSDRLLGYSNILGNPGSWPLIANPLKFDWTRLGYGDADFSHDLFSQIILRIGAIPMFGCAALLMVIVYRAHSAVLRLPDGKEGSRPLAARLMAIIVIFLFSQLAGPGMTVFPMNFWMGIFAGLLAVICIDQRKAESVAPKAIRRVNTAAAEAPSR
jgi:hypothetical protein